MEMGENLSEWPKLEEIRDTSGLKRGVNTTQTEVNVFSDDDSGRRRSDVPNFFNKLDALARRVHTEQNPATNVFLQSRRGGLKAYLGRLPTQYPVTVNMYDHIVPRNIPEDSSTSSVVVRETDLQESYFQSTAHRRQVLEALSTVPLSELGLLGSSILSFTDTTETVNPGPEASRCYLLIFPPIPCRSYPYRRICCSVSKRTRRASPLKRRERPPTGSSSSALMGSSSG
ncbi:hypothetical protein ADEAN_000133600 [Angomonas deanei]|uniref:Uncharacterized protein n=1 Tax=Angomonas deanei TaxID=59799 RepID=A0A7G2C7D8_9TRYP|nr:hypothetical protein ADEAN_000133600 [Angomonas deanei]